jgi:hypothetical protein
MDVFYTGQVVRDEIIVVVCVVAWLPGPIQTHLIEWSGAQGEACRR